jgi:hypothetical protein
MLKDTIRPNGTIKRIQYVGAQRSGTSSMGTKFKKGEPILHLSSSRSTGEIFIMLPDEVFDILKVKSTPGSEFWIKARPGKWARPTDWSKQLAKNWERDFKKEHGHAPSIPCKESCPQDFSE